jgi:hypothetical protein
MRDIVSSFESMDEKKPEAAQIQNAQINTMPPSVEEKAPISPSQQKEKQTANANKIYLVIASLFFILILGELGFVFVYHHSLRDLVPSSFFSIVKQKINNFDTGNATKNTSNAVITPVPIGQYASGTGKAEGFTVKVDKIIDNPQVNGDSPNKNLTYLEIDLSVTNNTNKTSLVPGIFLLQDAASGNLFTTADILGHLPDNTTGLSQKKVTIPSKNSLNITEIKPGQTDSLYLIYQIIKGAKEELVWSNYYTITVEKSAIGVTPSLVMYQVFPNGIGRLVEYKPVDPSEKKIIARFSLC